MHVCYSDNLAANFSRELADYIIYVIDVAGGDKVGGSVVGTPAPNPPTRHPSIHQLPSQLPPKQVPRKGGPGITQSDLLVINKTDLAEAVGADLERMKEEAHVMRGEGPVVMAQVKFDLGVGEIVRHILGSWKLAAGIVRPAKKKAKAEGGKEEGEGGAAAAAVAAEA